MFDVRLNGFVIEMWAIHMLHYVICRIRSLTHFASSSIQNVFLFFLSFIPSNHIHFSVVNASAKSIEQLLQAESNRIDLNRVDCLLIQYAVHV